MKFSTEVPIHSNDPKIDHNSKIFLVGSCFVENIGEKLDYYKFPNLRNPFGILYHPKGIEKFLLNAVNHHQYSSADIFFHKERWHCFDAHSKLSTTSQDSLVHQLNEGLNITREYLKQATHIIITLGTSWIYTRLESGETVANCHKLPQKNFSKHITQVEEINKHLKLIIAAIRSINRDVEIIFTISPVRHFKDGVVQNQQSKAHLIAAVHGIINSYSNISYFPAYEIVMDELRDYRFYAQDMLHPSPTAVGYIWERFLDAWGSKNALEILREIESIQRGLAHRSFNPESNAHQKFVFDLDKKIAALQKSYPFINFDRL